MDSEYEGLLSLTSDDIAALRAAEAVQFRRDCDGESCLKPTLQGTWDADRPRIYTAREQRLFPHVSRVSGDRYRKIMVASDVRIVMGGDTTHAQCRHDVRSAGSNDEWRTVARLLRPGDRVELRWKAGNDYPLITDAGLHRDELRMVLHRATNSPVFLIDAVVCADDTASMIRL